MAVGFVASATSGSQASVASFNIGTLGTGARAGIVFVAQHSSATDIVTGVTWNGAAMTKLFVAADTNTEPGCVVAYFLDNVTNGTITVSRTNNANVTVGYAASISAGAGRFLEVAQVKTIGGGGTVQTNADASEAGTAASGVVALDDGSLGSNSMRFAAMFTGGASPVLAGTGSTLLQSLDSTALGSSFVRETTAGQGSRNVGFATGTTDDNAVVAVAVREGLTTVSSSFTADAIKLATPTGSFTANAVIFKSGQTNSFTANAALVRTTTGSFTANAVIKRTQLAGGRSISFACGWEDAAISTHWGVTGSPVLDSTVAGRTGVNAARIDVTADTTLNDLIASLDTRSVTVVHLRFMVSALPIGTDRLFLLSGQTFYNPTIIIYSDGTLGYDNGGTAPDGPIIVPNRWYTIDLAADGLNKLGKWSVDGVAQTDPGPAANVDTHSDLYLGKSGAYNNGALSYYFDDVAVSTNWADYPIGPGSVQKPASTEEWVQGFTADAFLKRTQTGSFTANAVKVQTFMPPYLATVRADSPAAYWRLGESSGTTAVAEVGPNGTYGNTPTLGVTGLLTGDANTAVTFSRASVEDVGIATGMPAGSTVGASVEMWAYIPTNAHGDNNTLWSQGSVVSGYHLFRYTTYTDGPPQYSLFYWMFHDGASQAGEYISLAYWPLLTPTHVVATHDYVAKNWKLYLNGVLVGTRDLSALGTVTQLAANLPSRIGGYMGNNLTMTNGTLDEVATYNYVLTPTQVLDHFRAGLGAGLTRFTADAIKLATQAITLSSAKPINPSSGYGFGDASVGSAKLAQSFTAPASGQLVTVSYAINTLGGAPSDNVIVELYSNTAGVPGSLLATLETIPGADLGQTPTSVRSVTAAFPVVSGTVYWITARRDGSPVNAQLNWEQSSATYAGGNKAHTTIGSPNTWIADSQDLYIEIGVLSSLFTADALLKRTQSSSLTADAVLKKTVFTSQAVVFACGGDLAGDPSTSSHWFSSPGVTQDATHVRSGSFALKCSSTATSAYLRKASIPGGTRHVVIRFGVYVTAVPGVDLRLFETSVSSRLLVLQASGGKLQLYDTQSTDPLPLNQWVDIDLDWDTSANPHTYQWRINGVAQTSTTSADTAQDITSLYVGDANGLATADWWYDNIAFSYTNADYPIGSGSVSLVGSTEQWIQGFTADAVLASAGAGTITGSFTANATILRTQTGSLTANAALVRTTTGSFTANATLLRTQTSTFTANAALKRTQTSSFTANAVIKKTISGSLVADAIIKRTWGGVRYSGLVVGHRPVAYWQLGEASGNPQDSSGNGHNVTVVNGTPTYGVAGPVRGTTAVAFSGTGQSFTAPNDPGFTLADVFTLEAWAIAGATGASRGILCTGNGAYLRIINTGELTLSYAGVAIIVRSTVNPSTTAWQHCVATKNGSAVHLYIDGVDVTGTVTNQTLDSFAGICHIAESSAGGERFNGSIGQVGLYPTELTPAQIISHYQSGAGISSSFTADAVLKRNQTGSLTADAVLKRNQTGSLTANATILRTQTGSLSANAALVRTTTGSFTANATLLRTQTGSLTADAVLFKTLTSSTTADAVKFTANQAGSLTANAVKVQTFTGSWTADATLLRTQTTSLTTDAVLFATRTNSTTANAVIMPRFAADAIIRRTQTGSFVGSAVIMPVFRADAILKATTAGSFTASAWVLSLTGNGGSFSAQAAIFAGRSGTTTADAVLLKAASGSFTASAVTMATFASSLTASAVVKRTATATFSADAVFAKTQTSSLTADAVLVRTQTGTFVADAIRRSTITGSILANAVLKKSILPTFAADAVLLSARAGTFAVDSVTLRVQVAVVALDAVLVRNQSASFSMAAIIARTTSGSLTADAYVLSPTAGANSFLTDAIIQASASGATTADAVLLKSASGSTTADAVQLKVQAASFTASAVVKASPTRTLTADAVIKSSSTGSFTADAFRAQTSTGSFTASALARRTQTGTLATSAVLMGTRSASFSSDAWIAKTVAASFPASAWFAATRTGGFAVAALLRRQRTSSYTADAVRRVTQSGSSTADATIRKTFSGTLAADATVAGAGVRAFTADAVKQATNVGSLTADASVDDGKRAGSFTAAAVLDIFRTGGSLTSTLTVEKMTAQVAAPHLGATVSADHVQAWLGWSRSVRSFTASAVIA